MSPAFSPAGMLHRSFEDPLDYLPRSAVLKYRRGQTIYNPDQPSRCIFLVVSGKVKACLSSGDRKLVILDIYAQDEFFGESAFLGTAGRSESAVALERTQVMAWTAEEIEELSTKRPILAIAMMRLLAQRLQSMAHRIESFSVDNIQQRLARSLVRFSERLGSNQKDGSTQMIPFTHEFLGQYVGTSREIVTQYMNEFRRQGYLQYSRKGISLQRGAFTEWLRESA